MEFLDYVKWLGGVKAYFEKDPETNRTEMPHYLHNLKYAINQGRAKLEGDDR